jgi:TPR repeat protein
MFKYLLLSSSLLCMIPNDGFCSDTPAAAAASSSSSSKKRSAPTKENVQPAQEPAKRASYKRPSAKKTKTSAVTEVTNQQPVLSTPAPAAAASSSSSSQPAQPSYVHPKKRHASVLVNAAPINTQEATTPSAPVVSVVVPSEQETFNQLLVDARKHDPNAAFKLAMMIKNGWTDANGFKQPPKIEWALKTLCIAANLGSAEAHLELGKLLLSGYRKSDKTWEAPNPTLALQRFKLAADKGLPEAQVCLGNMHLNGWKDANGNDVKPDPKQAFELFSAAEQKGSVKAKGYLAFMYSKDWTDVDGKKRPADHQKAVQLYTEEAELDPKESPVSLACMYYKGLKNQNGIRQAPDLEKAVHWWTRVVNLGSLTAATYIGDAFITGWKKENGTEQKPDPEQAALWYLKAPNCSAATFKLGMMHKTGWKTLDGREQKPDLEKSVEFLTDAANRCLPAAQFELAKLKETGWPKADDSMQAPDPAKAVQLYGFASVNGILEAKHRLGMMYKNGWTNADGTKHPPQYDDAVRYLTEATLQKHAPSRAQLAQLISWKAEEGVTLTTQLPITVETNKAHFASIVRRLTLDPTQSEFAKRFIPMFHIERNKLRDLWVTSSKSTAKIHEGFLVTTIQPRFNASDTTSNVSFLSAFTIRGKLLWCMGHQNSTTAKALFNMTEYYRNPHTLNAIISDLETKLRTITPNTNPDIEKGQVALNNLKSLRSDLKNFAEEILDNNLAYVPRNNKTLRDALGDPDAPVAPRS